MNPSLGIAALRMFAGSQDFNSVHLMHFERHSVSAAATSVASLRLALSPVSSSHSGASGPSLYVARAA